MVRRCLSSGSVALPLCSPMTVNFNLVNCSACVVRVAVNGFRLDRCVDVDGEQMRNGWIAKRCEFSINQVSRTPN